LCIPVGDDDDIGDELVYIRSYTVVSSECIDNTQTYMYTHVYKQTNKRIIIIINNQEINELTNKEVFPTLLVDGFVHGTILFTINGGPGTDRMKGIKTCLHAKGFVEFDETILFLHELKVSKYDSTILNHFSFEFKSVILNIFELGIFVSCDVKGFSRDCGSKVWFSL
jgi:hypothetical protein